MYNFNFRNKDKNYNKLTKLAKIWQTALIMTNYITSNRYKTSHKPKIQPTNLSYV